MSTELTKWSNIKNQILLATDINILSKLKYSLEAVKKWAKQLNESKEVIDEMSEYHLRIQVKQGLWVEQNIPKNGVSDEILPDTFVSGQKTLKTAGINRKESPKLRIISKATEEDLEKFTSKQKETGGDINLSLFADFIQKPHVSHNSGENEWYTPPDIIESARLVMGKIDLDPASSKIANKTVKAKKFYTEKDDGLKQKWSGKIFMNPPYEGKLIVQFIDKLIKSKPTEAIVLVNNATETEWFQEMADIAKAICFPSKRIKFLNKMGEPVGAPLQGQAIIYIGVYPKIFIKEFVKYGFITYL